MHVIHCVNHVLPWNNVKWSYTYSIHEAMRLWAMPPCVIAWAWWVAMTVYSLYSMYFTGDLCILTTTEVHSRWRSAVSVTQNFVDLSSGFIRKYLFGCNNTCSEVEQSCSLLDVFVIWIYITWKRIFLVFILRVCRNYDEKKSTCIFTRFIRLFSFKINGYLSDNLLNISWRFDYDIFYNYRTTLNFIHPCALVRRCHFGCVCVRSLLKIWNESHWNGTLAWTRRTDCNLPCVTSRLISKLDRVYCNVIVLD